MPDWGFLGWIIFGGIAGWIAREPLINVPFVA